MESSYTRSEKVIQAFKRRKLAGSVYWQIHRMIRGFEEQGRLDVEFARVGLMLLLVALGLYVSFFKLL